MNNIRTSIHENGRIAEIDMDARERKVFVMDFLLSGKSPGFLFAERKRKEIVWLLDFIRQGPPDSLAMTDPSLFRRLSMRIIELKLNGWY